MIVNHPDLTKGAPYELKAVPIDRVVPGDNLGYKDKADAG